MQTRPLAEQFLEDFTPDSASMGCTDKTIPVEIEHIAEGFTDLLSSCGGGSFRNGLYRLHTSEGIRKWTDIVHDSFPEYRDRLLCFGYDWLGRHFALDQQSLVAQQAQILLFDPGFHEVLHIPCSFDEFHRIELPQYANDALAATFHLSWLSFGGRAPSVSECVGYRIPPKLGGADEVSNLEVIDMDVYWSLS
jgi:hypothetical protein